MSTLRIALAQINTCVGDIEGNTATILEWCEKAAGHGATLVAFTEMTVTGYPIEDLAFRASFRRAAEHALDGLAAALVERGLGRLAVVVGTLGQSAGGRPTNEAAVLRDG